MEMNSQKQDLPRPLPAAVSEGDGQRRQFYSNHNFHRKVAGLPTCGRVWSRPARAFKSGSWLVLELLPVEVSSSRSRSLDITQLAEKYTKIFKIEGKVSPPAHAHLWGDLEQVGTCAQTCARSGSRAVAGKVVTRGL
jgi:hypothetical protein